MNIAKVLLIVLFAGACSAEAAQFFIEPSLSYNFETTKLTDLLSTVTETKSHSPQVGLRLGLRSLSGVDLNLFAEMAQGKAETSGFTEKNNFTKTTTGFELGVNSLGPVKMYLGASLANSFKMDQSSQLAGFTVSGPSYRAGLLVRAYGKLNVGVQYNLNQYDKISGSAFTNGDKLSTYFSKVDNQNYSLIFSASF